MTKTILLALLLAPRAFAAGTQIDGSWQIKQGSVGDYAAAITTGALSGVLPQVKGGNGTTTGISTSAAAAFAAVAASTTTAASVKASTGTCALPLVAYTLNSGNLVCIQPSSVTGNAATATALAALGSAAGSGYVARGVDTSGNALLAAVDASAVSSSTNPVQSGALFTHAALTGTSAHGAASANTASAIVARDGSGNFTAGTITAALTGNAATATALASLPTAASSGFVCRGIATSGNCLAAAVDSSAVSSSTNPVQSGALFTHAALTGTSAHGATTTNTASQLVARDGSGNFAAGTITAALSGNATTATTGTNLAGGGAGQIPYQTGSGATTFLPAMGAGGIVTGNGTSAVPSTGTFTGTANQVVITRTGSNVVLSGPQDLATGSNPTFGTVTAALSGNATTATSATTATNLASGGVGQMPYQTGSGATAFLPAMAAGGIVTGNGTSAVPSTGTFAGTANQVVVTRTGSNIVLSTPQDLAAASNPTFGTVTAALSGNATTATTATNLATGTIGKIPYQSGTGTTAFLPSMGAVGIIVGNGSGVVPSTAVLQGTASQVTVTQTATAVTLSLPATINVGTSGNAATATALAANGTNCSAGNYPLGVDASGNSESCTAVPSAAAAATRQVFTSGSGTYTTPASTRLIVVRMVGGGGGGGGQGASCSGASTAGGNSSFNSIVANGGALGPNNLNAACNGGVGGTSGTGSASFRIQGGGGGSSTGGTSPGAQGGNSAYGGGAPAVGVSATNGAAAGTNSGGGGGGGFILGYSGCGGGAGEYLEYRLASPSGTYSYAVGAAGSGGSGCGNQQGGAGAAGIVIVDEYY